MKLMTNLPWGTVFHSINLIGDNRWHLLSIRRHNDIIDIIASAFISAKAISDIKRAEPTRIRAKFMYELVVVHIRKKTNRSHLMLALVSKISIFTEAKCFKVGYHRTCVGRDCLSIGIIVKAICSSTRRTDRGSLIAVPTRTLTKRRSRSVKARVESA